MYNPYKALGQNSSNYTILYSIRYKLNVILYFLKLHLIFLKIVFILNDYPIIRGKFI